MPVKQVEINAVQTRAGKLRIAKDLVDMAGRAKEEPDYI